MDAVTRDEITARALRSPLVLIVDDEGAVRRAVARLLRHYGFEVLEAESGATALTQLRARPAVCVVLLDQSMPAGSGATYAPLLRALCPSVRIIVHSAQPVLSADRPLFDDAIQKPAEVDRLVRMLDRWTPPQLTRDEGSLA
jgi:two-component system, cell cycle sensor histidine kinase and response regulator CckA